MSRSVAGVEGYLHRRPIIPVPPQSGPNKDSSLPDPDNVQGDVYLTLPKRFERFLFFAIRDTTKFSHDLSNYVPYITSSAKTAERILLISRSKNKDDLDFPSSNIAFSRAGLDELLIMDNLVDPQFDDSALTTNPHGVILVTAKKEETCEDLFNTILGLFNESITVLGTPAGHHLEGGREFFGWRDGISQPALDELTDPAPGQLVVKPGVIILGYPGDPVYDEHKERPPFTKDGSFMVYTQLQQDVWRFNDYVEQNWRSVPIEPAEGYRLTDAQRKSLFCARLFGRFASGVPLALSPYIDDKAFLNDDLINYFNFAERPARTGCPLFAHILKTNPRSIDLQAVPEEEVKASVIIRAGIPYGPEISEEECDAFKTLEEDKRAKVDRGLLFVSYQASISNGFLRHLNLWSRNDCFPPGFGPVGQDPIIGDPQKVWSGPQVSADKGSFAEPEYVRQLDGGLYFVPSIKAVREWATPN